MLFSTQDMVVQCNFSRIPPNLIFIWSYKVVIDSYSFQALTFRSASSTLQISPGYQILPHFTATKWPAFNIQKDLICTARYINKKYRTLIATQWFLENSVNCY